MSLKNGKCPNCNAALKFEAGKDSVVCEYCRSTFFLHEFSGASVKDTKTPVQPQIVKDSWGSSNTQINTPPVYDPWAKNDTYQNINRKIPPRPSINVVALVFLSLFYVFPAFIYLVAVHSKQKEWDRKYASRK